MVQKNVLIDTNVYGWALKNKKIREFLEILAIEKSKQKPMIRALSCDVVLREIRKTKDRELRSSLRSIHDSVTSGYIKLSEKVKRLASHYIDKCEEEGIKIENADALIVSSGTLAGVHLIITQNRKTMGNPKAIEVYNEINRENKLKTPNIVSVSKARELLVFSRNFSSDFSKIFSRTHSTKGLSGIFLRFECDTLKQYFNWMLPIWSNYFLFHRLTNINYCQFIFKRFDKNGVYRC